MRYGPEAAEEVVPPADAEPCAAGAPRLMVWMTPTPGFQADAGTLEPALTEGALEPALTEGALEPALTEGALEPALTTGAPLVVVTATGGGGS
jgi:hypothetical protein